MVQRILAAVANSKHCHKYSFNFSPPFEVIFKSFHPAVKNAYLDISPTYLRIFLQGKKYILLQHTNTPMQASHTL